jgi:hypothetical protein
VVVVLKLAVIVVKNVLISGIEECKMNKRIEKLFNEAGFHKPEMERLGIEHKFEKFAELIIRECMRMCDVAAVGYEEHGDIKEANGCVLASKYIAEHLGVEE